MACRFRLTQPRLHVRHRHHLTVKAWENAFQKQAKATVFALNFFSLLSLAYTLMYSRNFGCKSSIRFENCGVTPDLAYSRIIPLLQQIARNFISVFTIRQSVLFTEVPILLLWCTLVQVSSRQILNPVTKWNITDNLKGDLLYSWRFSHYSAPICWLVLGQMSYNMCQIP